VPDGPDTPQGPTVCPCQSPKAINSIGTVHMADSNPQSAAPGLLDPSSVHSQETSGRSPSSQSYRERLIEPIRDEYLASEELYSEIDYRDWKERRYQLYQCRTDAWLAVSKRTRTVSVLSYSCGLRWCPLCAKSRAFRVTNGVAEWLQHHPRPKLLTLTLKHSADSLSSQIDRLYASFRVFRDIAWLKRSIKGGIWFFQLKWIAETESWHPHLHVLLHSEYLPHASLKSSWRAITGDSDVVDIRVIYSPKKASEYVARYAARPTQLSPLSLPQRVEVFDSMHGRRLCGKFGTARDISFDIPEDMHPTCFVKVARYSHMSKHVKCSDFARILWHCYVTGEPIPLCWDIEHLDSEDYPSTQLSGVIAEHPPPDPTLF
jgi:hypothetical protein